LGEAWRSEAIGACRRHLEIVEERVDKDLNQAAKEAEDKTRKELAKHLLRVLKGETPMEIAPTYVSCLFDRFAETFDEDLACLNYQVPQLLVQAVRWSRQDGTLRRILDLGAGTGLLGEQLRDLAPRAQIIAVDLSEKMLQKAKAKGCYDEIHRKSIQDYLEACEGSSFNLVAAADVFVYAAELSKIFRLVQQHLGDGGLFAFSVEEPKENTLRGFQLEASGRVSHSERYILSIAHAHNLQVAWDARCPLRMEHGHPVLGHVFAMTPVCSSQRHRNT